MKAVQTILHPTDFSERSEYAFRFATLLARDLKARLIVLHVVPPAAVVVQGEMSAYVPPEKSLAELRQELGHLHAELPEVSLDHFLEEGDPATVILHVAQTTPCDLIVMGTHGRTGMSRVLMGSVAEQVVRKATCPVLTLKVPIGKALGVKEPEHQEVGSA